MKKLILLIACPALFASCGIYSTYHRSEQVMGGLDSLYRDTTDTYAVIKGDTANLGNRPWREVFTEPQLQSLISKALEKNTNVLEADLTIQQAQAGLKVARLAYYPSLTLSPQGTVSSWDFSKASKIYSVPVTASWQLGAVGSLRNNKKQADVSLEQSRVAKQAVNTSIIASVANMYYTLQMLDEQLKTTQATIDIWIENVRAMEVMKTGGMTTEAAVAQAKANYYNLLSTVPTLKQSIKKTENALCTVLHEAPHPIERGAFSADKFPAEMKAGVPLQLLNNRPDVRIAELNLASLFYGVNLAKSAFCPSLNITGQAGWTNSSGMGIVNPGKIIASAIASITQPLFANGQLRANLKVAKLKYEAAQLDYEQALLNAGQEVSDALTAYQTAQQQVEVCQKEVDVLASALEKTQLLYQHSTGTSYLETLTAQQSLIQAQLTLISDKFDKVQAAISLYQALGGGREGSN